MSKLVQFTDLHFPDLDPNSYDSLNNMKLRLMSPRRQSILMQIIRAFSFNLQIRVITSFFQVFCSVFCKGHSAGICRNGTFTRELVIYLLFCDSSHIFKILPNVRSTINGKQANTNL